MAVPCELWFFLVLIVHLTSINCSCHLLAVKAYNANKRRIRMWWLLLNSYTQMISLLQTHNNNCQIKQHDPWITMESNNSGKDLNFLAFALETGTCCCHEVHDDIILANYTEESDSYAFKGVAAFNEWRACSTWDAYTQQIYKLTRENNQNRLSPGWICFSLFLFSHSSVFLSRKSLWSITSILFSAYVLRAIPTPTEKNGWVFMKILLCFGRILMSRFASKWTDELHKLRRKKAL